MCVRKRASERERERGRARENRERERKKYRLTLITLLRLSGFLLALKQIGEKRFFPSTLVGKERRNEASRGTTDTNGRAEGKDEKERGIKKVFEGFPCFG